MRKPALASSPEIGENKIFRFVLKDDWKKR